MNFLGIQLIKGWLFAPENCIKGQLLNLAQDTWPPVMLARLEYRPFRIPLNTGDLHRAPHCWALRERGLEWARISRWPSPSYQYSGLAWSSSLLRHWGRRASSEHGLNFRMSLPILWIQGPSSLLRHCTGALHKAPHRRGIEGEGPRVNMVWISGWTMPHFCCPDSYKCYSMMLILCINLTLQSPNLSENRKLSPYLPRKVT
jgi:hypothetical protein